MTGRIHSVETMGTVDGSRHAHGGISSRMPPCACAYCHNPDTWMKLAIMLNS